MIQPFTIDVSDKTLADLKERLLKTRWPDEIGQDWQYGTDLAYLKELCNYWANTFDWRAQEQKLNRFHQRSSNPNALPLLMTHGWPGSVSEFLEILPLLTEPQAHGGNPEDAFHVICPSIPGYGFSDPATSPGFDQKQVALGHIKLMQQLGYEKYFVQGGDWGSAISSWTAKLAPKQVLGLHLTLIFAGFPKHKDDPFEGVTDREKALLESRKRHLADGTGYQAIQGTKPQSLGYALNDSPVGLAAWIIEKFHAWTDHNGDLEQAVSRDELLTNIMIYWVTNSITSSARLYFESAHVQNNLFEHGRIATPTGCAMFPGELYQPPRVWADALYNIEHWTIQPRGGHFAALEQPILLAEDLRHFFRRFR